ncbi:MAG: DNA replication/repair protein RecF [Chloroflexi bacterium]|nr:DNA replication/repair protein RecF [Chloroflexota bacterium]
MAIQSYATIAPMHLLHLSLTNFRNFIHLDTDLNQGPTILVGENAQGKTSLLEAIYYLAEANSPHASNDRQLINFLALEDSPPVARIVAEISKSDRLQRLEIRLILEPVGEAGDRRLRKEILINGIKRRTNELAGSFNAVLFLPKNLIIVEGSPSERRKYLNSALVQSDPVYADALATYQKVISQRNALLKKLQKRASSPDELEYWDEQLANLGATLMHLRALALRQLEKYAAEIHRNLTRSDDNLRLEYLPSYNQFPLPHNQLTETDVEFAVLSRETLRNGLLRELKKIRPAEIRRGVSLLGPHRDDFRFSVDGMDLRTYGSRGQNRTAMMALKLGEVQWHYEQTKEWPVLLLDEVLAELDPQRRDDLLQRVEKVSQAILTTADINMVNSQFREQAQIWKISNGQIHR